MPAIGKIQNEFIHTFNEVVYDDCINHKTNNFHLKITGEENGQHLHITSYTQNPEQGFCEGGAFIQKFAPCSIDLSSYSQSDEPVISCIILLTFNCFFVRHFLIPSIIANTTIPYEIIIVYNGIATDLTVFENFNLIKSETGCVSKAYNKGVATAKGKFIAIFHDDCLITSHSWHQPMIAAINDGAFATSTESVYNPHFNFEFLKGTPLLMSKTNYELIGGHDEFFFAGIEDLDFSYRIQRSGYSVKKVTVPYRHFNGMSTVILLTGDPTLMRTLFGYCLIPELIIEKWKTRFMNSSETQAMMHAVHGENLNYFKNRLALPINSNKLINTEVLTIEKYPTLYNIRSTYQNWLIQQFSSGNIIP
ncbi:Glycosyltransferase, GT2 family [Mucilaginibacter mallensis]|uniref:Glycosyltransferase, GT2 family n=1 Tax=Mucilaginibacter mallensis TaxID=652787 RepID=A0A1H1WRY5_MUCMA|nr:glycosyltransferase [Mucilaginibacter mallensis]SDS98949.1 Glycosyltransferase, GT2 family [Mucilaginibacter mallensis]